jgi:hypothetical protein
VSVAEDEHAAALRVVLRSTNTARFRLLTVVCGHNNHRLVVVYQTRLGPIGVFDLLSGAGERTPRLLYGPLLLDASVPASCRCRSVTLPRGWVREQLESGRPRVVYPGD